MALQLGTRIGRLRDHRPDWRGRHEQGAARAHHTAQWAKSGRDLFYVGLDGAMMSVPVETTPTCSFGKAAKRAEDP
jgi:hypothetical protein